MWRDGTRFAASGGWGYAQMNYNATTAAFTPLGTGSGCVFACHTKVAANGWPRPVFGGAPSGQCRAMRVR